VKFELNLIIIPEPLMVFKTLKPGLVNEDTFDDGSASIVPLNEPNK
jgi:hypothetical protein